jgi:cytochrome c
MTRELSEGRVLAGSAHAPETEQDKGERASIAGCDNSARVRERYAAAILLAGAVSVLARAAWAGGLAGDADRGEQIYEACQDCHSLDKNDVGPRHRGVFGRKAGSLPDYDYSDALKSANIIWNEETLDKWLTNPQAVAPGAKMVFHLENAQDRADVIAYLKERAK